VVRTRSFAKLFAVSLLAVFACLSLPSTCAQESVAAHNDSYNDSYKKWLNEDVRWIISDQERADFKKLWTDEQRDRFVVAFWDRRNSVPGAVRNAFKEEHYRRLAYANQHFAEGIPGWKTDRGRFYIMYGSPDLRRTPRRCIHSVAAGRVAEGCLQL
jgi:GWxTD domain-containing protein